jgi:nitrogen fixation protein NifU and related proteins
VATRDSQPSGGRSVCARNAAYKGAARAALLPIPSKLPGCQPSDEIDVTVDKVVVRQLSAFCPGDLLECKTARLTGEVADVIENEMNQRAARVTVLVSCNLGTYRRLYAEFLTQFAVQGRGGVFVLFDFAAGKFPFERVRVAPATLADEDEAVALDHGRSHLEHSAPHHAILDSPTMNSALLEHFQRPRNVGELAAPAVTVEVSNPACGDILRLSARISGERVIETAYRVRGCTASIAAGSALTELVRGRTLTDLRQLRAADIEGELGGLTAESSHAAVLAADAIKALLNRWPG